MTLRAGTDIRPHPEPPGHPEPPQLITEVARRPGHGAAVLLKIHAHCIDGQAKAANEGITDALGSHDAEQDPGGEGDRDSESAP